MHLLHRLRCPWSFEDVPDARYRGAYGELVAASFLRSKGLRILRRNFRWGRRGELDIVARHNDELVFCEVKSTIAPAAGDPARAVNFGKRRLLRLGAANWFYLLGRRVPARFDVVEVFLAAGEKPLLRWSRNVFPVSANQ